MQNFDPQNHEDRIAALELKFELLRNRLNTTDGHASEAGVGATQVEGVTIPAKEIGSYERIPVTADNAEASVMDKFLASKKG